MSIVLSELQWQILDDLLADDWTLPDLLAQLNWRGRAAAGSDWPGDYDQDTVNEAVLELVGLRLAMITRPPRTPMFRFRRGKRIIVARVPVEGPVNLLDAEEPSWIALTDDGRQTLFDYLRHLNQPSKPSGI